MGYRKQLGRSGETLAKDFLSAAGYTILEQNWRFGRLGEIDLIAYHPDKNQLSFVEVKTRSNHRFGHTLEAVTPRQQQALYQLAEAYLAHHPLPHAEASVSFDLVAVDWADPPQIQHLTNAF